MTTYNNTSISCIHSSQCSYFYRILTSNGDSNDLWFIGRSDAPHPYSLDRTIKLSSPYVSRHHACLRYSSVLDIWQIRHIGTTHPTWLNGVKLELNEWFSIPEAAIAKFAVNECQLVFSYSIEQTIQVLPESDIDNYLQVIESKGECIQSSLNPVDSSEIIEVKAEVEKNSFWQVAFIDQIFDELSALSNTRLIIYLMFFLAGFLLFLLYGAASVDTFPSQPSQEAPPSLD